MNLAVWWRRLLPVIAPGRTEVEIRLAAIKRLHAKDDGIAREHRYRFEADAKRLELVKREDMTRT